MSDGKVFELSDRCHVYTRFSGYMRLEITPYEGGKPLKSLRISYSADDGVVNIGRDPDNEIMFNYPTVSSVHGSIWYEGGTFNYADNNPTNRTSLNSHEIEESHPIPLRERDQLTFNLKGDGFMILIKSIALNR